MRSMIKGKGPLDEVVLIETDSVPIAPTLRRFFFSVQNINICSWLTEKTRDTSHRHPSQVSPATRLLRPSLKMDLEKVNGFYHLVCLCLFVECR